MNEKLLKLTRDYLDSVSIKELKQDLIECGLYNIVPAPNPIYKKNKSSTIITHTKLHYLPTNNIKYFKETTLKHNLSIDKQILNTYIL